MHFNDPEPESNPPFPWSAFWAVLAAAAFLAVVYDVATNSHP